jgi:hypothetical protein
VGRRKRPGTDVIDFEKYFAEKMEKRLAKPTEITAIYAGKKMVLKKNAIFFAEN